MNKYYISGGIVLVVLTFAIGRYTAPVQVKTVIVEHTTDDTDTKTNKDEHKDTTVVEVTKPDGTKETTTHISDDTSTQRDTQDHKTDSKSSTNTVTKESQHLQISLLASTNISSPTTPQYGAEISNQLIGPIRIGMFGFLDGRVGASLGLQF